jgi:hypothetical protein
MMIQAHQHREHIEIFKSKATAYNDVNYQQEGWSNAGLGGTMSGQPFRRTCERRRARRASYAHAP